MTNTCTGLNRGVTEVRSFFVTDQYVADFCDTKRGIGVRWYGIMKPEFDVYLGMAPESEVLQRMEDAAAGKK